MGPGRGERGEEELSQSARGGAAGRERAHTGAAPRWGEPGPAVPRPVPRPVPGAERSARCGRGAPGPPRSVPAAGGRGENGEEGTEMENGKTESGERERRE